MPRRVRFVTPPDEVGEELLALEPPPEGAPDATPQPKAPPVADLGPNSPQVLELLGRAAGLSPAERHRLGEAASWRWWPLTLPVGGPSAGARANAILAARRAGRKDAVAWLESTAAAAALGPGAADPLVVRAICNAGLALLTRDVIPEEVFDVLYGPWREVTHR